MIRRVALLACVCALGLANVSCLRTGASAPPTALASLKPEALALPPDYGRYNSDVGEYEPAPLTWTQVSSGEPVPQPECSGQTGWVWSDVEPNAPGGRGDPTVTLMICDEGSADGAHGFLADTPIEHTMIPSDSAFEAKPVSSEHLELSSDEAQMACLYGVPEECGGWAYLARYDRYIVMTQFMHAGHPAGVISEQTFGELVHAVDEFAARSLMETP